MTTAFDARLDAASTPPLRSRQFEAGLESRKSTYAKVDKAELIERLANVEEELSLYKLQATKRLYHFLNQRLHTWICEWKSVHDQKHDQADEHEAAALSSAISSGRASAEEALQMILALRPARGAGQMGGGSPATTLPLSVKARWQGAPSSTLKPVAVSQDWRALLAQPEPLLQVSAGPAMKWRLCLVSSDGDGDQSSSIRASAHDVHRTPSPSRDAEHAFGVVGWMRKSVASTRSRSPGGGRPSRGSSVAVRSVPVGAPFELRIEAVDGEGRLDDEWCSMVLLEAKPLVAAGGQSATVAAEQSVTAASSSVPASSSSRGGGASSAAAIKVDGLGFVNIFGGVGVASLSSTCTGVCELLLQDGGRCDPSPLSLLSPPPPLRIRFESGEPMSVRLVPSAAESIAGEPIRVTALVVDAYGNRVSSSNVNGILSLEAGGGASGGATAGGGGGGGQDAEVIAGLGSLTIKDGEATTEVCTSVASTVTLRVVSISGFDGAVTVAAAAKTSSALALTFHPGVAAQASLHAEAATSPTAGSPFALQLRVSDRCGNTLSARGLYAPLGICGRTIVSGQLVEQAYELSRLPNGLGVGCTVRSESVATPPYFWITRSGVGSGGANGDAATAAAAAAATTEAGGGSVSASPAPPAVVVLVHARDSPLHVPLTAADPTSYVLRHSLPLLVESEFAAVREAAEGAAAAAAAAAAETEAAERAVAEMQAASDQQRGQLEAETTALGLTRDAEGAAAAAAAAATEAAEMAAVAAEEATARATAAAKAATEATEAAAVRAAARDEAKAASVAAVAAREEAEVTVATSRAAIEASVASRLAADAALRAAWAEQQAKERAASDLAADTERGVRHQHAIGSPFDAPLEVTVSAFDAYGNQYDGAIKDVFDVDLFDGVASKEDNKGGSGGNGSSAKQPPRKKGVAARFVANSKDKLPRLSLESGEATFEVGWHESEGPRPADASGMARVKVVLTKSGAPKGELASLDFAFRHTSPARLVLGRHRDEMWGGEGPPAARDGLAHAMVGRPLVVPVMLIDRHGCVCGQSDSRLVRVLLQGNTSDEVESVECRVVNGVCELRSHTTPLISPHLPTSPLISPHLPSPDLTQLRLTRHCVRVRSSHDGVCIVCVVQVGSVSVTRMLAEEVSVCIDDADRVVDTTEDVALADREATRQPSQPAEPAASKGESKKGESKKGESKKGKPTRTGQEVQALPLLDYYAEKVNFSFHHAEPAIIDIQLVTPNGSASSVNANALTPLSPMTPAMLTPLSAGQPLEVLVRVLDVYGNPTEASWWAASKWQLQVAFEEHAAPKHEAHALTPRPRPPSSPMPAGLSPRSSGGAATRGGGGGGTVEGAPPKSAPPAARGEHAGGASAAPSKTTTLTLKNGEARISVCPKVAGELRLVATQQLSGKGGGKAGSAPERELAPCHLCLPVVADIAEDFDLVPLDQGAHGLRMMVYARDAYGNLDETCEREIFLEPSVELEGEKPGDGARSVTLPGTFVKLHEGVAELVTQAPRSMDL